MDFFTSDTHLSHINILGYDRRPFKDITEHDQALIQNWNSVVNPKDTVYHLGDVGLGHPNRIRGILWRLNGNICLIKGNHDKDSRLKQYQDRFAWVKDIYIYKIKNEKGNVVQWITLCHYAMRTWYQSHRGGWSLYGHSHNHLPENESYSFDVGVVGWNYTPVSFDQVADKMVSKGAKDPRKK